MPDLGKVTIFQPNRTTLVSSNYKPKPNVSLAEINDVSITGVENGYSLIFNSSTEKFEAQPISNGISITTITGGTF